MEGEERRKKILEILGTQTEPVSGTSLSKLLGVSRQVIVQDIALLRAVNKNILATTRGYILYHQEKEKFYRGFYVCHRDEDIKDELYTMITAVRFWTLLWSTKCTARLTPILFWKLGRMWMNFAGSLRQVHIQSH